MTASLKNIAERAYHKLSVAILIDNVNYEAMLAWLYSVDTNLNPKSILYDLVGNELKNEKGVSQDLIDYIKIHEGGQKKNFANKIIRFKKNWRIEAAELSDHYGVETTLTVENLLHC